MERRAKRALVRRWNLESSVMRLRSVFSGRSVHVYALEHVWVDIQGLRCAPWVMSGMLMQG